MAEKVNMPSQKKEKKKKRKKKLPSDFYDYNLLACTILLVSFGLIMLYSASAYEAASTFKGNDMYYFTHQAGLSAIVLVGIVILSKFVDYHSVWFQRIAALVYWGSLLLMAAVRFTPLGYEAYGARRWLRIGGGSLQPAEIGKLGLILYLPYIILKMGKNMRTIRAKAIVLGLGVLDHPHRRDPVGDLGLVGRHLGHRARRGHPVERLVGPAVGVDEHRAVGLDHEQAARQRQVGAQSAVVVDAARRNHHSHDDPA